MSANPQFAATPKAGAVTINVANANRDGTGTLGTVVTAGASGTRIDKMNIAALGVTTVGMVRMFLHDGATAHFWFEQQIAAVTPSGTTKAEQYAFTEAMNPDLLPVTLPSGWSIRAATHNGEAFKVFAGGGDI